MTITLQPHQEKFNKWIELSIFILIGLILGSVIIKLRLYLDDNVFIFPVILRSFFSHFLQFNYDNGLFRPVALIFYYFNYSLYTLSPQIAHLLPFALHLISGFLLMKLLRKEGVNLCLSLFASLFFILHPFATEQYMWLSSGNEILVNLIFIVQVLIINDLNLTKKVISLIFLLALISVFTFESTFFFFLPLSILSTTRLIKADRNKEKLKKYLTLGTLLFIPNVLYLTSKIIFVPHVLTPRLMINNFSEVIKNVQLLIQNNVELYFNPNSIQNFWLANMQNGLNVVLQNYILLTLFILFIFVLIKFLIQESKLPNKKIDNSTVSFWWLVFLTSLFPLFALKVFNFPFRALFLPSSLFLIAISVSLNKFLNKEIVIQITSWLLLVAIALFLFIDISIALKYHQQSQDDDYLTKKIKVLLAFNNFNDQKPAYLVITNFPHSTVYSKFLHADHIVSCYNYWWCGQASLNMITGMVKDIGIEFKDKSFSTKTELPYNLFLQQRPIVKMNYIGNGNLNITEILEK